MKKYIKKYSVRSRASLEQLEDNLIEEATAGMSSEERRLFYSQAFNRAVETNNPLIVIKANCSEHLRALEDEALSERTRRMPSSVKEIYLNALTTLFLKSKKGYIIK